MQTMQQRRAKHALENVQPIIGKNYASRFKAYAQALPAMIHMNGLGQAVAFYRSKDNGQENDKKLAYRELYRILSSWLNLAIPSGEYTDLLERITNQSIHEYRLAQAEALAYLDWLKRFAEAFIEDPGQPAKQPDQTGEPIESGDPK